LAQLRMASIAMATWTVFVMRNQLEPGLHLEFHQVGSNERSWVPSLAAGDSLRLRFPEDRRVGVVIKAESDGATIEVRGSSWSIRLAAPTETIYRSPRGMKTVEWIVGDRV
jgi:hypothetical protein